MEIRIDAFQLSNTPQFGPPGSTLGSTLDLIPTTLGSGQGNMNGIGGGQPEESTRISWAGMKQALMDSGVL
jgi:hypothetical protein